MNNGTLLSFVCKSEELMRLERLSAVGRDKRRGRQCDSSWTHSQRWSTLIWLRSTHQRVPVSHVNLPRCLSTAVIYPRRLRRTHSVSTVTQRTPQTGYKFSSTNGCLRRINCNVLCTGRAKQSKHLWKKARSPCETVGPEKKEMELALTYDEKTWWQHCQTSNTGCGWKRPNS